jgi:acyl-coenzyme A synthetase/AMP-(fatty) acid ligase
LPADTPLNLIYTSGSTGLPKGSVQTHRNALWEVEATTRLLHYQPEDRFALIVPYTFGASITLILNLLLNGASVFPFNLREEGISKMAAWLKEEGITVYYSVPTVFRHWMNALNTGDSYSQIRLVKLGGEPVVRRDLEQFKQHFSDRCVLRNSLGTTENYLVSSLIVNHTFDFSGAVLPVGYPPDGKEVLILDAANQPLPVGEAGQIAVRSRYLSPGYWHRPDLTEAAYLPDPEGENKRIYLTGDLGRINPAGYLEHLGRMDDMVKIRGQRVELAELEMALLDLDRNLREVAVSVHPDLQGENCLVAYTVSNDPEKLDFQVLRNKLIEILPDHMVPTAFVQLERLPLLPIGKLNRSALPIPDWNNPITKRDIVLPGTPVEKELFTIWGEALGLTIGSDDPAFGVEDNFVQLGGNSLQAATIASRIRDIYSVDLPTQLIYEQGTIARLSIYLEQVKGDPVVASQGDEYLKQSLRLLGDM